MEFRHAATSARWNSSSAKADFTSQESGPTICCSPSARSGSISGDIQ